MNNREYVLLSVIVNFGQASKLIQRAKKAGCGGATVLVGKGTAHKTLLGYLGLKDVRKEIVLIILEKAQEAEIMADLAEYMSLRKPGQGIAFSMPLANVVGLVASMRYQVKEHCADCDVDSDEDGAVYRAIFCIVDRERGEDVVEVAEEAGATGGTIIHAFGSADPEKVTFDMPISPEKDMVLILTPLNKARQIVEHLVSQMAFDLPNQGILFVMPVHQTYGLNESRGTV